MEVVFGASSRRRCGVGVSRARKGWDAPTRAFEETSGDVFVPVLLFSIGSDGSLNWLARALTYPSLIDHPRKKRKRKTKHTHFNVACFVRDHVDYMDFKEQTKRCKRCGRVEKL